MCRSDELELLQRHLSEIRVENSNAQKFVPDDRLPAVLTKTAIANVLRGISPAHYADETIDFVLRRAPKVFSVLVLIGHINYIKQFMLNDQLGAHQVDHKLPFTRPRLLEILRDDYIAELFHEKQWEFIAPVFSGQITPRNLEPWSVLPFLSERHLTRSGYGSVFKIRIHPAYRPSSFEPDSEFVRKELDLNDGTFENEARILATLQRLKHPNILLLVGCYTYRSKHNLISPFVSGGNLRQYLQTEKPATLTRESMFCSVSGLSSAIWALHEFVLDDSEPALKGHHQDLKHDNILVDGSRFILADFGLSSIKSLTKDSRTPFKGRRGLCQAPECANLAAPYQEYDSTRATDVFAFACIIVDLLIYLQDGPHGVVAFQEAREFQVAPICYNMYHKGATSNDAVSRHLEEIAKKDTSRSMQDVVRVVQQMFEISPQKRPRMAIVTAKLYVATTRAFRETLAAMYTSIGSQLEVIIEKLRFESWVICQDTDLFLSMPGATTTGKVFDASVKLLHDMSDALSRLKDNDRELESRSLLEVRGLNTQLLNMLSAERREISRSHLEASLLAELETRNQAGDSAILEAAFGESRIPQMAATQKLVALAKGPPSVSESPSFRTILSADFMKKASGQLKTVQLLDPSHQTSRMLLRESIQYQDMFTGQRIRPRIQALCTLLASDRLSSQLRVPPFYALCDNKKALCYDLLYEYPSRHDTEQAHITPISLRHLLSDRDVSRYPSLDSRRKLALDLAEAIAAFHDVSWFHKDLTSFNVLFFPAEHSIPSTRSSDPYLFGFQHSRDASDDMTEGPLQDTRHQRYHHPGYISVDDHQFKRFVREYDWYSLGILLLEIGFWKLVDDVMSAHSELRNDVFAQALLDTKVPQLAFLMGTEYVAAVKFCLTSPSQPSEPPGPAQPNLVFRNEVVRRLQTLVSKQTSNAISRKRKLTEEPVDFTYKIAKR